MKKNNDNDKVDHIKKALENISHDRSAAGILLMDIMLVLKKDPHQFEEIGMVAAKFLEVLQKSNEQLVKIALALKQKEIDNSLSEKDKEELFDILQKETKEGKNN